MPFPSKVYRNLFTRPPTSLPSIFPECWKAIGSHPRAWLYAGQSFPLSHPFISTTFAALWRTLSPKLTALGSTIYACGTLIIHSITLIYSYKIPKFSTSLTAQKTRLTLFSRVIVDLVSRDLHLKFWHESIFLFFSASKTTFGELQVCP